MAAPKSDALYLVADIGGTNSRFALIRPGEVTPRKVQRYVNRDFAGMEEVIRHYLSETGTKATRACLAVAGPVTGDTVKLTNCPWQFSLTSLKKALKMEHVRAVNDFTALAMAIPYLKPSETQKVGGGFTVAHAAIGVVGSGTGLGVSGLVWSGDKWVALSGEGGHVNIAPSDDFETELLHLAWKERGFVAAEDLLNGAGLTFLYTLMAQMKGWKHEVPTAEEITRRALEQKDKQAVEVIQRFCAMLGSFAGNHALTLGAFGGMYIGGGIVPRFGELFTEGPFRHRFEAKGPFSDYVSRIPTFVITDATEAAFRGAAAVLNQG